MRKIKEIRDLLEIHKDIITKNYGVKKIGIFGSYVRGEQNETSDIDILVEFEQWAKTFDNYMDLKFFLEDILQIKVDLISVTALKPRLKDPILREVIYV